LASGVIFRISGIPDATAFRVAEFTISNPRVSLASFGNPGLEAGILWDSTFGGRKKSLPLIRTRTSLRLLSLGIVGTPRQLRSVGCIWMGCSGEWLHPDGPKQTGGHQGRVAVSCGFGLGEAFGIATELIADDSVGQKFVTRTVSDFAMFGDAVMSRLVGGFPEMPSSGRGIRLRRFSQTLPRSSQLLPLPKRSVCEIDCLVCCQKSRAEKYVSWGRETRSMNLSTVHSGWPRFRAFEVESAARLTPASVDRFRGRQFATVFWQATFGSRKEMFPIRVSRDQLPPCPEFSMTPVRSRPEPVAKSARRSAHPPSIGLFAWAQNENDEGEPSGPIAMERFGRPSFFCRNGQLRISAGSGSQISGACRDAKVGEYFPMIGAVQRSRCQASSILHGCSQFLR